MYAVILAGGAGTRLWPLARAARPKPFLNLGQGKSLFRLTYERVVPLVGRDRTLVVTGAAHVSWVSRQAPEIARDHVIVEAAGRNTAASIALAALWILSRGRDGIMLVLPSDHWVAPASAFRSTLRKGIRVVGLTGGLLTIGLPARAADPGFGYIRPSGAEIGPGVRRVTGFVEKPDARAAGRMIRSGGALWNSGIFAWRATTILDELRRHRPGLLGPLEAWARGRSRGTWRVPAGVLRRVPAEPIDRAVLERSDRVLVARASFRWNDLGNWASFAGLLQSDRNGNRGLGGLLAVASSRCLGVNEGGLSVFVGMRDVVAVRSGDALLVCRRDLVQRVREVVARLGGPFNRFL